jgi:hypothetical protein
MLRRPSVRASVTTVAAAVVLVGGANLASYAATGSVLSLGHHAHATQLRGGTGSGQAAGTGSKVVKFHLGSPGKTFAGGSAHLFSAKVPTGTYQVGVTGFLTDFAGTTDSYTCLVADKRDILKVLAGTSQNLRRVYAIDGAEQGEFAFGALEGTNEAQKIDRAKIAFGCLFNGTGPFKVKRTLSFTLRAVNVVNKSGSSISVTKSGARKLSGLLR